MKLAWAVIASIGFGFSCCEDKIEPKSSSGFVIKTGQACGWCAGADTLTITEEISQYYFKSCDDTNTKDYEVSTDRETWNELLADFDYATFSEIEVNTCQICSDGCDTWISVQNYDMAPHLIRFVETSPEIEPIREFVNKLQTLRVEFKNK